MSRLRIGFIIKNFLKSTLLVGVVSTILGIILLIFSFFLHSFAKTKPVITFFGVSFNLPNLTSFILVLGITYFIVGGIIWILFSLLGFISFSSLLSFIGVDLTSQEADGNTICDKQYCECKCHQGKTS